MNYLSHLNSEGFIPGPNEGEVEFFSRIKALQDPHNEELIPLEDWKNAQKTTYKLFSFSAHWIKAFYSNQGLKPWEGAAIWMGNDVKVQLRYGFKKGKYLKIYSRDELLAHEAVHAARMAFQEPRFEEFFAYMTSSKKWRRIMGPLFQTPRETLIFIIILLLSMVSSLINLNFVFLPILMVFLLTIRLIKVRKTFKQASRKLENFLKGDPLPFLFRLTDKEIYFFAKESEERMKEYIRNQNCFRWETIKNYFNLYFDLSNP